MRATFVVVDDHPVFRYGLVSLVESEEQYQVLAQAGTMPEALTLLETRRPDILLVDLTLGADGSGLDLLKVVKERFPTVRTLVVSIHNDAVYAERAREAGAWGYVMKQASSTDLKGAIRSILGGKTVFSQHQRDPLAPSGEGPRPAPLKALSPRELEVLELLGKGHGVTEMAGLLGLSAKTIGVHQDHIKTRLGVANNYELRRYAIEWLASR